MTDKEVEAFKRPHWFENQRVAPVIIPSLLGRQHRYSLWETTKEMRRIADGRIDIQ